VGLATILVLALGAATVATQSPASASETVAASSATLASADTGAGAAGPSAVGGSRDYIAEVRANFTPENRAYSDVRAALGFISPLYEIAVALLLLFSGLSARFRDIAYARAKGRYLRVLIYLVLFSAAGFVLDFPLSWYRGFALEHQYGLSNQNFGAWLGDEAKDFAVNIFFLGVAGLLSLAYLAIEKSPRRWWMWLSLGTVPVIVISVLIEPVLIDPLYNKFVPLKDQQLKTRILELAAKADIPGRNVYQVDKSKQTKKINAYVNGFGASQRIVLWDTTLKSMKEDEILVVMGHEMGHYKLGHIWKEIIFLSVLSVGLYFFSWLMMSWAVARFGGRWKFHELHDVASLPLLSLTIGIVSLVAQPAFCSFNRAIEHEADVFGLEVTHSNDAAARAFIKLASQNKSNPEPSAPVEFFEYTHPPLIERIRFAMGYKPWEEGKPNRAFKPKP